MAWPMEEHPSQALGHPITRGEFSDLERRVGRLEKSVFLERGDMLTPWRSAPTVAAAPVAPPVGTEPWVSKSVRIHERLTSYEFSVRAQLGQALLFGLGGAIAGAGAAWLLELPWSASPVLGVAVGATSLVILLIDHRGLVHRAVKDAGAKKPKYGHLRVEVTDPARHNVTHLFLKHDVERADLRELAQAVLNGSGLQVHSWVGVGGWTRPKFDNVMRELEQARYVRPGRGNKPRELSAKGRALFRAWAE